MFPPVVCLPFFCASTKLRKHVPLRQPLSCCKPSPRHQWIATNKLQQHRPRQTHWCTHTHTQSHTHIHTHTHSHPHQWTPHPTPCHYMLANVCERERGIEGGEGSTVRLHCAHMGPTQPSVIHHITLTHTWGPHIRAGAHCRTCPLTRYLHVVTRCIAAAAVCAPIHATHCEACGAGGMFSVST